MLSLPSTAAHMGPGGSHSAVGPGLRSRGEGQVFRGETVPQGPQNSAPVPHTSPLQPFPPLSRKKQILFKKVPHPSTAGVANEATFVPDRGQWYSGLPWRWPGDRALNSARPVDHPFLPLSSCPHPATPGPQNSRLCQPPGAQARPPATACAFPRQFVSPVASLLRWVVELPPLPDLTAEASHGS